MSRVFLVILLVVGSSSACARPADSADETLLLPGEEKGGFKLGGDGLFSYGGKPLVGVVFRIEAKEDGVAVWPLSPNKRWAMACMRGAHLSESSACYLLDLGGRRGTRLVIGGEPISLHQSPSGRSALIVSRYEGAMLFSLDISAATVRRLPLGAVARYDGLLGFEGAPVWTGPDTARIRAVVHCDHYEDVGCDQSEILAEFDFLIDVLSGKTVILPKNG